MSTTDTSNQIKQSIFNKYKDEPFYIQWCERGDTIKELRQVVDGLERALLDACICASAILDGSDPDAYGRVLIERAIGALDGTIAGMAAKGRFRRHIDSPCDGVGKSQ